MKTEPKDTGMQPDTDMRHPYRNAFFAAFVLFLVSMLPILIPSGGRYLYYGDYNAQTLLFTEHIHAVLHSGSIPAFDWQSGLGMDFLTSYGGYFLSPFSLILLLPASLLHYGITFCTALKIGISAVTAALYCKQYVRRNQTAFLCGMLYAFSGFQLFNLVYPFGGTICLFPLLLYAFDRLVLERRPLAFALLLGISGYMDSLLLSAECMFIMLYYIVRVAAKDFPKPALRDVLRLGTESLAGVGLCCALLVPSLMSLRGNARAGALIFDADMLAYQSSGVLLRMVQSMFFPPEFCRSGWYFKDDQLSMSPPLLYIPLFTVIGAAAVFRRNRRAWESRLLTVCALFACVPLLNSLFSALNGSYYARWFFCPLLILILLTGRYLDDADAYDITQEFRVSAAITGFFVLYGIYTVLVKEDEPTIRTLWLMACSAAVCGLAVFWLMLHPKKDLSFISRKNIVRIVCVFCTLPFLMQSTALMLGGSLEYIPKCKMLLWNDMQPLTPEPAACERILCTDAFPNTGLNWGFASIQMFNSMTAGEESTFYARAGIKRLQSNNITRADYPLATFLSVKRDLYANLPLTGGVEIEPEDAVRSGNYRCEGYHDYEVNGWYMLFTNDAYIPMGFTYDYYLPISDFKPYSEENEVSDEEKQRREMLLLKAIWLDDDQIARFGDILEPLPDALAEDTSVDTYYADCAARRASACTVFTPRGDGFDAQITLEKENLVFFSVPCQRGFTASVDGQRAEIERVFDGLSAVLVPAGTHEIAFDYATPGLPLGIALSLVCAGVLAVYGAAAMVLQKKYTGSNSESKILHKP